MLTSFNVAFLKPKDKCSGLQFSVKRWRGRGDEMEWIMNVPKGRGREGRCRIVVTTSLSFLGPPLTVFRVDMGTVDHWL